MLSWIFGDAEKYRSSFPAKQSCRFLELENARVRWFLSLDYNDLPSWLRKRSEEHSEPLLLMVKKSNTVKVLPICIPKHIRKLLQAEVSDLKMHGNLLRLLIQSVIPNLSGLQGDYHPILKIIKNVQQTYK